VKTTGPPGHSRPQSDEQSEERSQREWLGREDSNLESGPERCGTESGRPSVACSLIGWSFPGPQLADIMEGLSEPYRRHRGPPRRADHPCRGVDRRSSRSP